LNDQDSKNEPVSQWREYYDSENFEDELLDFLAYCSKDPFTSPTLAFQMLLGLNTMTPSRDPAATDSFPKSFSDLTLLLNYEEPDEDATVQTGAAFYDGAIVCTELCHDRCNNDLVDEDGHFVYDGECWRANFEFLRTRYRDLINRFSGCPPEEADKKTHPITGHDQYRLSTYVEWVRDHADDQSAELIQNEGHLEQTVLHTLISAKKAPTLLSKETIGLYRHLTELFNSHPDPLSREIDFVLVDNINSTEVTASQVMSLLEARAGAPDSCIQGIENTLLVWRDEDKTEKKLTKEQLKHRLLRRKKAINARLDDLRSKSASSEAVSKG